MRKTLLFTLFMSSATLLIAQSNFIPSKIVLTNGDTISGLINDQHWEVSPTKIEFQKSPSGTIEELGLNDLLAFIISNGLHFEKHFVKFDNSREELNFLSSSRDPLKYAEGEYFLRLYIRGGVSLYSLADENLRVHYFVREENKNPVELLNRSFHTNVGGRPVVRTFEAWKQQLVILGTQCQSVFERVNSSKYTHSSLEKIVQQINQCRGTQAIVVKPESKKNFRKPEFGIALQAFSEYTAYTGIGTVTTRYRGVNFGAGIFTEIFFQSKTSFYGELKIKSSSQDGDSGTLPSIIERNSMRLVTAVRKSFGSRKVGLFVDFGLTNGFRTAKFSYKNAPSGSIFARHEEEKKFETGAVVAFGAKIPVGNLSISPRLTYEYETAVKTEKFAAARNMGVAFGIGF